MKKVLLLTFAALTFAVTGVKAQQSFGQSYLKVSFTQPMGEYKDYYNAGFGVETGRMFPLFVIDPEYNLSSGLDLTFLYTSFNFGKEHFYGEYPLMYSSTTGAAITTPLQTESGLLWNLGVKVGPMVSLELVKDLSVDFSFQYAPTVVFSFRKGPKEESVAVANQDIEMKSAASVSFAHRFSFKGNLRYQHFVFGLEYLFGGTTLHYGSPIIPNWQKNTVNSYNPQKEKDMGLGTLALSLGLTF